VVKWIADILLIGVISFVAYCISIAVERKQIANMIIMVAVILALQATIEDITPVIERMNARIDSLQSTADRVANVGQSWDIPMKGVITQYYKGEAHHGIDIGAPEGTIVEATRKGEVSSVGWSDIYGNVIIVDHGSGMQSLYAHLSGLSVKAGYPVIAGTKIGNCGNTGKSTGPHLHFEIRKNGTTVDPMSYLK
jgi:murein DD-endopeptidase MepM/ murein hydrolase activator NlpD